MSSPYGPPGPAPAPPGGAPWPPAPPPRRSRGKRATIACSIIAAVAVAVPVAGIGFMVWLFNTMGGSEKPANLAWTVSFPQGVGPESEKSFATSLTGNTIVSAGSQALRAYDRTTGKHRWTVRAPESAPLCEVSPPPSGNVVAAVYGAECSSIMTVDVSSGERKTTFDVGKAPEASEKVDLSHGEITLAGNRVVVSFGDSSSIAAFSATDGSRQWATQLADPKFCYPDGVRADGNQLLVLAECWGEDDDIPPAKAVSVDPRNGEKRWSYTIPESAGNTSINIASAKPALLYLQGSELGRGTLVALDGSGKERWQLTSTGARWKFNAIIQWGLTAERYEISGNTLVVEIRVPEDEDGLDDSALMGIDLTTGKRLWRTERTGIQELITTPGKSIVAWQNHQGTFQYGYEAVRISPKNGSAEVFYSSNDNWSSLEANPAYAVDGWLYFANSERKDDIGTRPPHIFAVRPE